MLTLRSLHAVLLLTTLIAIYPALAQSQQPPQRTSPPIKKENVTKPSKDSEGSYPIPAATPSVTGAESVKSDRVQAVNSQNPETSKEQPNEDWWHRLRTDPVATFTGLLFFATIALWWSTRSLVKGADSTAEKQLRAYVSIVPAEFIYNETSGAIEFGINMENSGQTPAYDVQFFGAVAVLGFPLPAGGFQQPSRPGPSKVVIHPRHSLHGSKTSEFTYTRQQIESLAGVTEKRLYCLGVVTYVDAFGKRRKTNYCISYPNNVVATALAGGRGKFEYAEHHNDAS